MSNKHPRAYPKNPKKVSDGIPAHDVRSQPWVIVFGSERIAMHYSRRKGIHPNRLIRATGGIQRVRGLHGPVTVLRTRSDVWVPPSFADEQRCREVEQVLKDLARSEQIEITEELFE